jgi:hypothetical protein
VVVLVLKEKTKRFLVESFYKNFAGFLVSLGTLSFIKGKLLIFLTPFLQKKSSYLPFLIA